MKSIVQAAAAALLVAALAPAAFAQQAAPRAGSEVGRIDPGVSPFETAGQTPICSQLEMQADLSADECGQMSLGEVADLKFDRDNSH